MRRRFSILLMALIGISAFAFDPGTRIAWVYSMRSFVNQGVYARVKLLSNREMALVYNTGDILYIRKKSVSDKSWGNPIQVSVDNTGKYNYTNAELSELSDGRLIYVWNARPKEEGEYPYKIMMKFSDDCGDTWYGEQDIYVAGVTKREGCWEPVCLEMPSGELQVYFANEYGVADNNQNITLLRSIDQGKTWGDETVVCFRDRYRDGMPVPVLLQEQGGIAVAIEDNGIDGTFKPAIIYSTLENNWADGPVGGSSENRWEALRSDCKLSANIYAGAPYLIQLENGETVLSVQSGEGRDEPNTQNSALMQVYVGDKECRNFARKSTPFQFSDSQVSVLWNSLCAVDSTTLLAVSSISGLSSQNGIWTATGRLFNSMEIENCEGRAERYGNFSPLYLGAEGYAHLQVKSAWDNSNLYLLFDVFDPVQTLAEEGEPMWQSDGVEVYIDPLNKNTGTIASGMFKLLCDYSGQSVYHKSVAGVWQEEENDIVCKSSLTQTGYTLEMIIPWSNLGGRPETDFGIHIKLHNNDNNKKFVHENLSGGNGDKPNTWLPCVLKGQPTSMISFVKQNSPVCIWVASGAGGERAIQYEINGPVNSPRLYIYAMDGRLYSSHSLESASGTLPLSVPDEIVLLKLVDNNKVLDSQKILLK
ncbi:hypothetical protein BARVI_02895 [Barnesiella viscericola DSM 18177]|uniref:Carbohydrate-binding domain-containing protein n=2 Tax=Barnesiella viscericola TaxID=397865 RepID=W0ES84_9BACT|nr:hypothetical protein BARVI_02895 [Barnesiella viscericola DSM 18177]